jgi:hypothetical protein
VKLPRISRRDMLLASAAGVLGIGVGVLTDRTARADYIAKALPRLLPGVEIDPETYPTFEQQVLVQTDRSQRITAFMSSFVGRELVATNGAGKFALDEFDRIIVLTLLGGTDLATRAEPTDGPLIVTGWPPACANPFQRPPLEA